MIDLKHLRALCDAVERYQECELELSAARLDTPGTMRERIADDTFHSARMKVVKQATEINPRTVRALIDEIERLQPRTTGIFEYKGKTYPIYEGQAEIFHDFIQALKGNENE